MDSAFSAHSVEFFNDEDLPGLEIRSSSYRRCSFSKHAHETWSVGTVLSGEGKFTLRRTIHSIARGHIVVVPPEEVHACNPGSESPWAYLMFHTSRGLFHQVFEEMYGEGIGDPVFSSQVFYDSEIHRLMISLVELLKNGAPCLEKQATLFTLLRLLLFRHARPADEMPEEIPEPSTVTLIKKYLAEHLEKNVSMHELSNVTGVSVYHMLNVFRRSVGIPPHAYQVQMRIKEARKLLLRGYSIVDAALETGFYDQSHFTKKFKPSVGLTPRRYIRAHQPD